jgi:hypothetical protein
MISSRMCFEKKIESTWYTETMDGRNQRRHGSWVKRR